MGFLRRNMLRYYTPPELVKVSGYSYYKDYYSYTHYDYLQPGVASLLRLMHFEYALRLTKEYFHKADVIDFGCADGPFLPSLSKNFNHVAAIDRNSDFLKIASELVNTMQLDNVKLICNSDMAANMLKTQITGSKYSILLYP